MLDRVDARAQCRRDAVGADRVRRHHATEPVRFIHDRFRLSVGEIDPAVEHAVGREVVAAVAVVLDPVGPVLHLLAHREARGVPAVDRLDAMGQLELPVRRRDRIHPRRRHRARRGKDAGPRNLAVVDRELYIHVGIHRAFSLEIPDRGKAMLQRNARVAGRENGAIGSELLEQLVFVILRRHVALQQKVGVRVDEPGQHGHLAEIDYPSVRGLPLHLGERPHRLDPFAFDQDSYIGLDSAGPAVDQTPSLDQDHLGSLRTGNRQCDETHEQQHETAHRESSDLGRGKSIIPATEAYMPVHVTCECGTSYHLKDEFAGKLVKCPHCGRPARAPTVGVATAEGDPAFDRDTFLLRQQMLKISEKYDVCDEQGNKIVFVEGPAHLLRNLGAVLVSMAIIFGGIVGLSALPASTTQSPVMAWAVVAAMIAIIVGAFAAGIALSVKRHVTFYRDESKREKLLSILQDKKFQPITMTYTVRDARGRPIAKFGKNLLFNVIRKRWYVWAPDGRLLFLAKED